MEDKDFGFLDLALTSKRSIQSMPIHELVQESVQFVPDQYVSNQEQNPKSMPTYDSFRFSKVYSREKTISYQTQVQESNLCLANGDMVSPSSPLHHNPLKHKQMILIYLLL